MLLERLFPEHRLEGPQNLLFILLTKHVGEFSDFFALFRAADKFFAHDCKLDSLILIDVASDDLIDGLIEIDQELVIDQTHSAKFVRADGLLAHNLVLYQVLQVKRFGAGDAFNQVGGKHFENQC